MKRTKKISIVLIVFILSALLSKGVYDFIFRNRTLYDIQPVSFVNHEPVSNYYIAHTNENTTKTIIVISDDNLITKQSVHAPVTVSGKVVGLRIGYHDIWGISMPYITYDFQADEISES